MEEDKKWFKKAGTANNDESGHHYTADSSGFRAKSSQGVNGKRAEKVVLKDGTSNGASFGVRGFDLFRPRCSEFFCTIGFH